MSTFSIKPGVDLSDLSQEMFQGMGIVASVYFSMGYNCTVTSGRDGTHMPTSKHYDRPGNALDFRTRDVIAKDRQQLANAVKAAIGKSFDVVLEGDHLHVEYDPK